MAEKGKIRKKRKSPALRGIFKLGCCGGLDFGLGRDFFGGFDGFADDTFESVDLVLDIVAELEGGHHAFFDLHRLAGTRVPCGARLAGLAGERTETADFDGVAFDEFFADQVEELLDDGLDIVTHKSGGFGNLLDKGLFCYVWHGSFVGLIVF